MNISRSRVYDIHMDAAGMESRYIDNSKTLCRKREALISEYVAGRRAGFLQRHARILDDYFRSGYETSLVGPEMGINQNPYAIIALGGYGREEQCVHSDVDLLVLFKKSIPDKTEALIREMIYPLWDIGLDMGYATRSMKECLALASSDFEVLTSLLDARFICGVSILYSELMKQLYEKVIFRRSAKILSWFQERTAERHTRFGDAAYLLEPNIKDGRGGLRDFHTIWWASRIKYKVNAPRELEYEGLFSHDEYHELEKATDFILTVRNHLHYNCGKKYDRLLLPRQQQLAEMLNYQPSEGRTPVETFLGDLCGSMDVIRKHHAVFLSEISKKPRWRPLGRKGKKSVGVRGLEIKKDMAGFASSVDIMSEPLLLLKLFAESARMSIPPNAEAMRLARHFARLADTELAASAAATRTFEQILAHAAAPHHPLEDMLAAGVLQNFIPEFKSILNRVEYDAYHVFPVDKHAIYTVEALNRLGAGLKNPAETLCYTLYQEIPNKNLLHWAGLLHDIGKGRDAQDHAAKGAELTRSILRRRGLKQEDIDTAAFLVQEHLFLINAATRRDIGDEETIAYCAGKIRTADRLKMLYLLTVADFMATGPQAWNDWLSVLLRDLTLKLIRRIDAAGFASRETMDVVERKKKHVLSSFSSDENKNKAADLFSVMSARYLASAHAEEIREHVRLHNDLDQADFSWKIVKNADANTRTVYVCARDIPDLFSKTAGVFTLNGVNILEARAQKWRNHVSLFTFQVTPPPDEMFELERWTRAEKDLERAMQGRLDIGAAVRGLDGGARKRLAGAKPFQVKIDNESSRVFTIIEIFVHDFPGLLFTVTEAIFKLRLDVWSAQIATKADQVVDVFYVKDFDGRKVDAPRQAEVIRRHIEKVLTAVEAPVRRVGQTA